MTVFRKIAWLLTRRSREADLEAELRFHLEEEAAARENGGLPPAAARLAASRELGNLASVAEHTRQAWSWRLLDDFSQDLRYALRGLAADRAFAILAILSLAFGIGANTGSSAFWMPSSCGRLLPPIRSRS